MVHFIVSLYDPNLPNFAASRFLLVAVDWGGLVVAARFESASVISGGMVVVVVGAKVVVVGGALANFIGYHTELQSFQNVSRS